MISLTQLSQQTQKQRYLFIAICLFLVLFIWFWYQSLLGEQKRANAIPPDFSVIDDAKLRKQSFIDFLYPLIVEENTRILQKRSQLLAMQQRLQTGDTLTAEQKLWLSRLATRYSVADADVDSEKTINRLLKHLNVIPPSLVLAQAANETAWGTSRFATQANNYFGQWCYREGCGLVPLSRKEGRQHEVRSFDSVTDSVQSYLYMLNSGRAYSGLRSMRQQLEEQQKQLSGVELAAGLSRYSERGHDYVKSIRTIIKSNDLMAYTEAFYNSLETGGLLSAQE